MGVESNVKQNLENLSGVIIGHFNGIEADAAFSSFQAALEYVFKKAQRERIVLAIDEYPYIARCYKGFASILQLLIDKYKDNSKLMLILCGSSMSYMEENIISYKAPLYGRRTAQMKVNPFDFFDTCSCFENMPKEEKALIYGITGGTPQYLAHLNPLRNLEYNIKNTFLNPSSFVYEEPLNLLKQEVRDPSLYNAIITAVANGASRMADIAAKVGETTSVCSSYLKNLIALGIIKKETPYGQKESRKSIYLISDNMFRFWFRFVPNYCSLIELGAADLVYKKIAPFLPDYMGKVFEDICAQYLWRLLLKGESPVEFKGIGRWWRTDPRSKTQVEIDIMGEEDKNTALFAECKWTNEKVDAGVLRGLVSKSELFRYKNPHFYLFSKSGFTESCARASKEIKKVKLISYADIVSIAAKWRR